MPTGTVRLYDVIQSSSPNGMARPPRQVNLNSGAVRLFLSPSTFDDPGLYQSSLNDGDYNMRNSNAAIRRKLELDSNSRAFFRVDTGGNLRRSLFRSIRYDERAFRRMGNVNFDLFRINVNQDAYLTKEKVFEAIALPELVREFLESLSIRVLGINIDLINEEEIERILGSMAQSVENFGVNFTRNKRLRVHFRLENIRFRLPADLINTVGRGLGLIDNDSEAVCDEYFFEQLNVNLFLNVRPNRTIASDDQINFTFDTVRINIPNGAQVRGCPSDGDNTNTAPNLGNWEPLVEDIQDTIRDLFRNLIGGAVTAVLSPIGSALMRYVNIEMEAEFDRMMDTVIDETMERYDNLIDINRDNITKTISHFSVMTLRRPDENGRIRNQYALKPVLVYGVLTSSPRITVVGPINRTISTTPRIPGMRR